eukprot:9808850-Alexandrium_andersonii.AAC.1
MRARLVMGDRWRVDRSSRAYPSDIDSRARLVARAPVAAGATILTIHGGGEAAQWPAAGPYWVPPPRTSAQPTA